MTDSELSNLNKEILALAPDRERINERLLAYSKQKGECVPLFTVLPPHPDYFAMQGGCSDGKDLFIAFVRWEKDGESWKIDRGTIVTRVDAKTGEILQKSENLVLHHSNDIVYLPHKNELVVVHNRPCRNRISILDATTLSLKEERVLERDIFSITYNPKRRLFAAGKSGGKHFVFFDEDFRPVRDFEAVETQYVTQGMTSDDDYIYFLQFHKNCIVKYDWDGNFCDYIPIGKDNQEPEHIEFLDGRMLVVFGAVKGAQKMAEVCEVRLTDTDKGVNNDKSNKNP